MKKTCEKLTLFFIWDIMKFFLNCNYPSCWLLDSAVQILGRIKLSYELLTRLNFKSCCFHCFKLNPVITKPRYIELFSSVPSEFVISGFYCIYKQKNLASKKKSSSTVNTLVIPYFHYCSPAWSNAAPFRLNKINKKIVDSSTYFHCQKRQLRKI